MSQSERFERLSYLFEEIASIDPAERDAAIEERCGGDTELASELRALLAADASGDPDTFFGDIVATEAATLPGADAPAQRLGSWRVVRPLAEGGMGSVYVAERADGAFEARAAIKLVRGGVSSPLMDQRFRDERQILAGLSHPGIAKLLDGGSTSDGTPYLVMELIEGDPITEWCTARDLGLAERLRLFLRVCDSVVYAHGALVAHRDLKPSNILVTADGEPKLLDFGIAKLMDTIEEGAEGATRSATLLTPAYASPEQVAGRRAGVGTDVYALGVLLYELLTGRLPIETRGLTPVELGRVVAEDVPPLMSSISTRPEWRRRLSGDLDAVVSHALRKEPIERYPSVQAMADDIERHLEDRPVGVRRDDWAYRTGKMVRRNAGVVSGGVLTVLSLLAFTVTTALQSRTIARERDRAEAQRVTAERVGSFLEEILTEADPDQTSGLDVPARVVLDRGASRVFAGLGAEPEVQAALATVMGRVYRKLGEYDAAAPLLDSGLVVRRRIGAADPLSLGQSLHESGVLAYDVGDYEESTALHREALESFRRAIDGDDPLVADALDGLASAVTELGLLEEAEDLRRENLAMNRRLHPDGDAALASSLINLADVLRDRGAFDEAITLGEEALPMARAVNGDVHLDVAHALNQLASSLNRSGRYEDAVPLAQEGLAIRRTVFPGPHVETAASLGNLAGILRSAGRMEESEVARRESIAMFGGIFPGAHPYLAASLFSLGALLLEVDKTEEAVATLVESVDMHREVFPPAHPNLGYPLTELGRAMLAAADPVAAEAYLREAYTVRRDGLPEGHWHVAASGLELGRALDRLGRVDEAERYLAEALETLTSTFGADDSRTRQARQALRAHLQRRGLTERAAALGPSGS